MPSKERTDQSERERSKGTLEILIESQSIICKYSSQQCHPQCQATTVAKIITSIVFAHYTESQLPSSFQSTIDAMFKENGLPKVNFPQQIVTKAFKKLLQQTTSNLKENSKVNEKMETDQTEHHNKQVREMSSPEVPKKKREIERDEYPTTSNENRVCQPERPVIAPKPLLLRDPCPAAAARENEHESERRRNEKARARSVSHDQNQCVRKESSHPGSTYSLSPLCQP